MARMTGLVRETGLLDGHGAPGVGMLGLGKHILYSSSASGNIGNQKGAWTMDQRIGQSPRNIEAQQAAVTENQGGIEARVQETVEGLKSTVHNALEGFKQLQEAGDGAKSAVDNMLERVQDTTQAMVERMEPAADLLNQVHQHPWLLMGSAILTGYILGRLTSEHASSR
jgi:ElaB/YqjD/DUF883 family membrane-anchored ribosome-binding protein